MGRCEDLVRQLPLQGLGVGGGGLAGIPMADVGCRTPLEHDAVLQKGGSRRRRLSWLEADEHVVGSIAPVDRAQEGLGVGVLVATHKGDLSGV